MASTRYYLFRLSPRIKRKIQYPEENTWGDRKIVAGSICHSRSERSIFARLQSSQRHTFLHHHHPTPKICTTGLAPSYINFPKHHLLFVCSSHNSHFLQYPDAKFLGCGEVTPPGLASLPHVVWKCSWPSSSTALISTNLSITHLELVGRVLGYQVLEVSQGDLAFKHMGIFDDNTSSVSFKRPSAADSATLKLVDE